MSLTRDENTPKDLDDNGEKCSRAQIAISLTRKVPAPKTRNDTSPMTSLNVAGGGESCKCFRGLSLGFMMTFAMTKRPKSRNATDLRGFRKYSGQIAIKIKPNAPTEPQSTFEQVVQKYWVDAGTDARACDATGWLLPKAARFDTHQTPQSPWPAIACAGSSGRS